MRSDRREFFKLAAAGVGALAISPERASAVVQRSVPDLMGKSRGKRLVILGASFGGIQAALTVRRLAPEAEIVLLEKAPFFVSCPATLEYVFGMVSLDRITRGYSALQERGLRFARTTVVGVDRDKRRIVAADGGIEYDYLLVATGVRMAYEEVPGLAERPGRNLCVYDKGWPIIDLHHAIAGFQGGDIVIGTPPGPYKCPPGPYEYALLWADYIKKKGLKARVTLVDPRPKPIPPPLATGFLNAMDATKHVLTYHPNTRILAVDAESRTVDTEAGKVKFDLLSVIPPNKPMPFLAESGLGDPFIETDPQTFRAAEDERIYALGDTAETPFTRSAYCAFTCARVAGHHIARALGAAVPDPGGPQNICWPLVSMESALMILVNWSYERGRDGTLQVKSAGTHDNEAKPSYLRLRRQWEMGLLREMFGA
jgi:NADPH-dependent 2,4-dienoyl-CoA reductase/sulfur reductase-like enzyme